MDSNIYYSPEDFGLKIVSVLEMHEPDYDFDMTVAWQDIHTGDVYWAHDSGCSCPSPFENILEIGDLTPVRNTKEVSDFINNYWHQPSYSEKNRFLNDIRKAMFVA